MKSIVLAVLAASSFVALPLGAFAAPLDARSAPASGASSAALDPVTVTATRTPVPLADALSKTVVINRAEIERAGGTSVADVLRHYADISLTQLGGAGQPASAFVRGGNSNYTVVLIDGVRVNDGTSGLAPLADISPEMIQRVEIVEGPRATLYGADAIGGVINIITRQPGPDQLDVAIGGGRYGTVSGAAALRSQGKVGGHAWGVAWGVQQQHVGGFPTFAGSTDDSAYRNRTVNGRARIDLGRVQLEARAWDTSGNTQYQNLVFSGPSFSFSGFTPAADDFHDQMLALEARGEVMDNWTSSLTLARSAARVDQAPPRASDFVHTARPEIDWHNVVTAGPHHRVSFGARVQSERVSALSFGTAIHENTVEDYGYVQDELNYGRNHAVAAVNYLHNSAFGDRFDWSAEYGYDLFARTRLIASVGSAFHAPTANDRFGFGGNPHLKPEKALDYELAVRQGVTTHQNVELRLFRTDVRDLVSVEFDSSISAFKARNVDKARLQGVQFGWRYVDSDWSARIGAMYLDPRNRTDQTRLLRRPNFSVSAQVDRHMGRFDFGAGVRTASDRADVGVVSAAPVVDGGYALFDLSAGVRLTANLRLQARLDNAFNHHYQTANGYNQAGSAVYATLRYKIPL